jgi:anaerobic selenocysteine-containing dehydrogenase
MVLSQGAMLIDTPGMRELGLLGVSDGFNQGFEDILLLSESCRYANCSHEHEHSEMHQIVSLRKRHPDPIVDIHRMAAARFGICDGDWVYLELPHGRAKLKARLFDGIEPDVLNAEHAWWYPEAPPPDYQWKESCANLLYGDDHFDPDAGSEPLKCYLCKVYRA